MWQGQALFTTGGRGRGLLWIVSGIAGKMREQYVLKAI